MYSPIFHVASRKFFIGKIEDHQTVQLTEDEVEEICKFLNEHFYAAEVKP